MRQAPRGRPFQPGQSGNPPGVTCPRHQLSAGFLQMVTYDLDNKIEQLPFRHLNPLVADQRDRIDRPAGPGVKQAPARSIRRPGTGPASHRHQTGMPVAALSDRLQTVSTSWYVNLSIHVLDADEEQLISEPKRQVFQKWRITVGSKPGKRFLHLRPDMLTCRLPTTCKLVRGHIHLNVVHGL